MTYWNRTGKFQEAYTRFFEALVPSSGPAETLEGELLRAINRIYWDLYNNGFGNNWSGALEFLKEYGSITAKNYDTLQEYSQGRIYHSTYKDDDPMIVCVEELMSAVLEMIESKNGNYSIIPCDLFDLQLKTIYYNDEGEEQ